jgi:hypothetical protein
VGAASGNVKALRLRFTGARNNCCVEHAGTLLLRVRTSPVQQTLARRNRNRMQQQQTMNLLCFSRVAGL